LSELPQTSSRLARPGRRYGLKLFLNGILLAASYAVVYFAHYGGWDGLSAYRPFLLFLGAVWFLTTLFSRKFKGIFENRYWVYLNHYFWPDTILAALVSLGIYMFGWYSFSRSVLFGGLGLFLLLELAWISLRFFVVRRRREKPRFPFAPFFFLGELLLATAVFSAVYYFKRGSLELSQIYLYLFLGIVSVWIVVSLLLHRFHVPADAPLLSVLARFWKSELLIIGVCSAVILLFRFSHFSRFIVLGSLLGFALVENSIVFLRHVFLVTREQAETGHILHEEILESEIRRPEEEEEAITREEVAEKYIPPEGVGISGILRQKLHKVVLGKFGKVFEFLDHFIDLDRLDLLRSVFLFSSNSYNVEILEDDSLLFFLNLERVNSFRRINQLFVQVNRTLRLGGVFAGIFESQDQRRKRFFSRYPALVAWVLTVFDFIFRRLAPKLPFFKRVYFFITRGANRVLSKTEVLGRLYYCGFELIAIEEIDHRSYFIVRKAGAPRSGESPSYGLLFRQRRLGKGGRELFIYKLRTMHPYSEYLHKYILDRHPLDETGKVKRDFRISGWGRVLRKLWIDELPMLLNWIKGDLKLVGVRPLSPTFFATYPEELQKLRVTWKPGLIPPYYADMPEGIEAVWESERLYLERYSKRPVRTDTAYFFKAMKNILFHHARSL